MSKLMLSAADSIAVNQYLEKAIGLRGTEELSKIPGVLRGDITILISHLIPFESLYPGIVGSVVAFIIGLLTNKDPIHEKLNDPEFVEAERNRFRDSVLGKEEKSEAVAAPNSIDELYETLTTFFNKIKDQNADGL